MALFPGQSKVLGVIGLDFGESCRFRELRWVLVSGFCVLWFGLLPGCFGLKLMFAVFLFW